MFEAYDYVSVLVYCCALFWGFFFDVFPAPQDRMVRWIFCFSGNSIMSFGCQKQRCIHLMTDGESKINKINKSSTSCGINFHL